MSSQNPGGSRLRIFYAAAFVLSVIAIVLNVMIGQTRLSSMPFISDIVLLLFIVIVAVSGWEARRTGRRPSLTGLYVGLFYGVPTAIYELIAPVNQAALMAAIHQQYPQYSGAQLHRAAVVAAGAEHLAPIVVVIGAVLLGLLFGWVGSLFFRKPPADQAV